MEFFKKSSDVYGEYCEEELHKATEDFFEISRRIKQKLGDKSYKLDRYRLGIRNRKQQACVRCSR